MRWGARSSQNGGGPLAHAAGALVVPKQRRPPHPCRKDLGGRKTEEAHSPMRRRPPWSRNGGGALANVAGALAVPKRRRPRFSHGASLSPKQPTQDGRDLGVSVPMWEVAGSCAYLVLPWGIPIRQAAHA